MQERDSSNSSRLRQFAAFTFRGWGLRSSTIEVTPSTPNRPGAQSKTPTDDNLPGHIRRRHRSGLVAPGGLVVGVERMRRTSIMMLGGTAHSSRKAKTLSLTQITSLTVTASILTSVWGILIVPKAQARDA